MNRTALALGLLGSLALGFAVHVQCQAADSVDLSTLTPLKLLQLLKEGDGFGFGVAESRIGWVREEDVPALMELIDSTEACLPVVHEWTSSIPPRSTIGQEAAMMVRGFRTGRYPPELYARPVSPEQRTELMDWWAARCPRVDAVKTMPFRDERGIDAAYDKLRFEGACEGGLLDALHDSRKMADPRQAPPYEGFSIADAALFILLERRSIELEQVLPDEVAARIKDRGVYAYFDYVATPKGRRDVVDRVERLVAR